MIPARPPKAPPAPTPIQLSKLLLVEGDTPMHFFEALLQHLGLQDQIEIRNFGGITDLRSFLPSLLVTPGFKERVKVLAAVRDAEENAYAARQSINDALTAAGLTPQAVPQVRTAIFILPDGQNPGKIETLCMRSVSADPAYSCVEKFFDCVRKEKGALPVNFDQAKAYAQVFLATRENVQLFPGVAAYRGYWSWDSAVFAPLNQFLQSL